MNSVSARIESRKKTAIQAILRAYNAESEVGLFVSHHLEEIDSQYWLEHLNTSKPTLNQVLDMLVLRSHWDGENEDRIFDFTLPNEITNYVISVCFNDDGVVDDVVIES